MNRYLSISLKNLSLHRIANQQQQKQFGRIIKFFLTNHRPCSIIHHKDGDFMFFDFGFDSFHQERYLLEVFVGNQLVQSQRVDLPPPIAQQQFIQLCQQAKESGQPMTVKMSKDEKITLKTRKRCCLVGLNFVPMIRRKTNGLLR